MIQMPSDLIPFFLLYFGPFSGPSCAPNTASMTFILKYIAVLYVDRGEATRKLAYLDLVLFNFGPENLFQKDPGIYIKKYSLAGL